MCLDEKLHQFEAGFYDAMPATFVSDTNEAVNTFALMAGSQPMQGRRGTEISNDFNLMATARLIPRDSLVKVEACVPPEL